MQEVTVVIKHFDAVVPRVRNSEHVIHTDAASGGIQFLLSLVPKFEHELSRDAENLNPVVTTVSNNDSVRAVHK